MINTSLVSPACLAWGPPSALVPVLWLDLFDPLAIFNRSLVCLVSLVVLAFLLCMC